MLLRLGRSRGMVRVRVRRALSERIIIGIKTGDMADLRRVVGFLFRRFVRLRGIGRRGLNIVRFIVGLFGFRLRGGRRRLFFRARRGAG